MDSADADRARPRGRRGGGRGRLGRDGRGCGRPRRALVGAGVRRVLGLSAASTRGVRAALDRVRPRDAARRPDRNLVRRGDGLSRDRDGRVAGAAGRRRRSRIAARGHDSARASGSARLRRSHRRRRSAQRGPARARLHDARDRRRRRRPVRRPGRADRGRERDPRGRSGRGPARAGAAARRNERVRPRGREGGGTRARSRGRRLRLRRGRIARDDGAGAALDARRRHDGRRRPPGGGCEADARPARLHEPREDADRHDLRLGGSGRRVASPARPRSGGELELASLVGPSFPLERADDAFQASLAGSPGRVLVTA